MGRYYKLNDSVYYYEDEQLHLVTEFMQRMSEVEIDRHINPEKYMTTLQRTDLKAMSYRNISKLQLKLTLLSEGLLANFESYIAEIQDPIEKLKVEITYIDSTNFDRLSAFIITAFTALGFTSEDINSFWEKAASI